MIRAATRQDVIDMIGQTFPEAMRAFVLEDQGELLAIGGVRHTSPLMVFSDIKPGIKRSPRAIVDLAHRITGILGSYSSPIFAIADTDEPTSENFLSYLGFEHSYTSPQGEVFQWPQQS